MRRLITVLVAGIAVALAAAPAMGAPHGAAKVPAKQKSLAQNGRFHQIHTKKLAMDCGACHKPVQGEVLLQVPRAQVVDREICLGCHKEGSKPAWYGVAAH